MKLFRIILNKYLITAAAFAAWMFFFDQNDYFTQRERLRQLKEIEGDISYLKHEIESMEQAYQAMQQDPRKLEQFARERYRMKRDNEDVYVIE